MRGRQNKARRVAAFEKVGRSPHVDAKAQLEALANEPCEGLTCYDVLR